MNPDSIAGLTTGGAYTHDDGGPAFPTVQERGHHGDIIEYGQSGMSLRDHFAGEALAAVAAMVAADRHQPYPGGPTGAEFIATSAYQIADAMLRARSATGTPQQDTSKGASWAEN